jgi:hypothetical protein
VIRMGMYALNSCFVWSHPQVVLYIEQSRKTVKHVHLGNHFGIDGIDRFPKVLSRRDCVWEFPWGCFRFSLDDNVLLTLPPIFHDLFFPRLFFAAVSYLLPIAKRRLLPRIARQLVLREKRAIPCIQWNLALPSQLQNP